MSLDQLQYHFDHLEALPSEARAAPLARLRATEPTLAAEVADLLAAAAEAPSLLDAPLPAPDALTHKELGPYRLEREVGYGGMGRVFLAYHRMQPTREVALKIMAMHHAGEAAQQRFAFEQAALARMNHSYIARLYDAGRTEDGCPYIAMEYVQGEALTHYADRLCLTLSARLDLFVKVCRGVAHAHLKGILHRDLKPGNILVVEENGVPIPKIIDFGIARPLDGHSGMTRTGQPTGTWSYMGPEQLNRPLQDQDFRTDVYGLGATLYALLVGAPPLQWPPEASHLDICRDIAERVPERASRVWQAWDADRRRAMARRFGTSPERLMRSLRTDLDWILAKALEKDPDRRYRSVGSLCDDLLRYGRNLPVSAGPPGVGYRLRKLVARRRGPAAAAAVSLLLITVALGLALGKHRQATHEAAVARRVVAFLEETFREADPYQADGRTVTAHQILETASVKIRTELGEEPEIRARLTATIGEIYGNYGAYARGQALLEDARAIQEHTLGHDHPQLTSTLAALAEVHLNNYRLPEAEELARTVVARRRAHFGTHGLETAEARLLLGNVLFARGVYPEAADLFEQALATFRARDLPTRVVAALDSLGYLRFRQGDHVRATQLLEEAAALGDTLNDLGRATRNSLANHRSVVYAVREDLDAARRVLTENLQRDRDLFGDNHPDVIAAYGNLAGLALHGGDHKAAEAGFRDTLARIEASLGPDHPLASAILLDLGNLLLRSRRYAEAEAPILKALDLRTRTLGPTHLDTAHAHQILSLLYAVTGDARAAEHQDLALRVLRAQFGETHPNVSMLLYNRAYRLMKEGRLDEADTQFAEARVAVRRSFGADHSYYGAVLHHSGGLALARGRVEQAVAFYREAVAVRRRSLGDAAVPVAESLYRLGIALNQNARPAEALEVLQHAYARVTADAAPEARAYAVAAESARALAALGAETEARQLLEEAFAGRHEGDPADAAHIVDVVLTLFPADAFAQTHAAAVEAACLLDGKPGL